MHIIFSLTLRQKCTYCAHFFKALFHNYHQALIPTLKRFISKDSTIIDIGGHAGQFTKIFSKLSPKGHVYTFEPGNYAYSILKIMKKIKHLQNVSIFKMGISSDNALGTLSVPIKASGSIGYGRSCVGNKVFEKSINEEIELTTLDTFLKKQKISHVTFIKIDVEGHEVSVLEGAQETIKNHRPTVMIEINRDHLSKFKKTPEDIVIFFKNFGYTHKALDEKSGQLVDDDIIRDRDYIFYKE
jgi:FkbM family methyltransferase